jgi:hypothetical protein
MYRSIALIVGLTLAFACQRAEAQTMYGCSKPTTGRVSRISTVVPVCKPPLVMVTFGQGPTGPAGPEGPAGIPGGGPVLVDSSDAIVGVLTGSPAGDPCPVNVVQNVGSYMVGFAVSRDQIVSCFTAGLLYASNDCTGPVYIPAGKALTRTAQVYAGMAYFAGDPFQSLAIQSRELPDYSPSACAAQDGTSTPGGGCCFPTNQTTEVGPAATFDVSAFVAPFHAE